MNDEGKKRGLIERIENTAVAIRRCSLGRQEHEIELANIMQPFKPLEDCEKWRKCANEYGDRLDAIRAYSEFKARQRQEAYLKGETPDRQDYAQAKGVKMTGLR